MLKHHRYGTGYLMEATGRSEKFGGVLDIGHVVPAQWHKTAQIPKVSLTDIGNKLNIISKIALAVLEELPQFMYIKGIPNSLGADHLKDKVFNPKTLDEFMQATAEATSLGYPPAGFGVILGGPSVEFVKDIIDRLYTAVAASVDKKITPAQVQKALVAYAKQHYRPSITTVLDIEIRPEESPKYMSSRSFTKFKLIERGSAIITYVVGTLVGQANARLSPETLNHLQTSDANVAKNRKEITQAITEAFYTQTWRTFQPFVYKHQHGVSANFEQVVNNTTVGAAFDKAKGKPTPETHPKPPNTARESGPNPVLHPSVKDPETGEKRTTVVKREPRGPFVKVSGSVRSTSIGGGGDMVVTAEPTERQWMNAQGFLVTPDPLPRQAGDWIPSDRIHPLYRSPSYDAYFGVYYDHPLLKPSTNAQVFWYGNMDQFIRSGKEYGQLVGDVPYLSVRIIDKRTSKVITRQQLSKDKSPEGQAADRRISQITKSYQNSVAEGKRNWLPFVHTFLGKDVKFTQDDMPSKPGKKGEHPEGTDADKWSKYVAHVRSKGESVLGLKFGAQKRSWTGGKEGRMFKWSRHEIPGITRMRQNMEFSGERDKEGNLTENWGVYLIEYLLAHKTYGVTQNTYMIPVNVIRADEDVPPRRKVSKVSQAELKGWLASHFGKFPISHKTDWHYQNGSLAPSFPYTFLYRISVAQDNEIERMNEKLARTRNPHIIRTTYGYIIDNVEWDAYQMIIAMPPSAAAKKFGLMSTDSYSRLLVDDPGLVNRISRAVGQHASSPTSLQGLGLTPRAVKTQWDLGPSVHGTGNPYAKEDPESVDLSFGKTSTPLPSGYWASKLGERWEPIIKHRLDSMGRIIDTFVAGFQHANSFEEQGAKWREYAEKAAHEANVAESEVTRILADMFKDTMGGKKSSSLGKDLYQNIRTYIRYVKVELNAETKEHIMVPSVVQALGMTTYKAPFAAVGFRNVEMSVKAPSEEIAQMMIALKLLRRSASNKVLGKAMNAQSVKGTFRILPDLHARVLAQWKAAGYPVVADYEAGNVRRLMPREIVDRSRIDRAKFGGEHRFARMLRSN